MEHMTDVQIGLLCLFALTQVGCFVFMIDTGTKGRIRNLWDEWFRDPYYYGITVGDVLRPIFFLPAMILLLIIFGLPQFIPDAIIWILDFRITKGVK